MTIGAPRFGTLVSKSTGSSIAIPYPTGVDAPKAGELMLIIFTQSSVTLSGVPSGWSNEHSRAITGSLTPAVRVYSKRSVGGETGTVSCTTPNNVATQGQMVVLSDVDITTPLDVVVQWVEQTVTTATTFTVPTFNVVTAGALLIGACAQNVATGTFTPPSSPAAWTEDSDSTVVTPKLTIAHLSEVAAGATGAITFTSSAQQRGQAFVIALRPRVIVKTETVTENFDAPLDTASKWFTYNSVSLESGQLRLDSVQVYSGIVTQAKTYDLRESSVHVKLTPPAPANSREALLNVYANGNPAGLFFGVTGAPGSQTLMFRNRYASANHDTFLTYDPVQHAWLRVRLSGTTAYWDTSPDGVTWTNRYSEANTADLSAVQIELSCGQWAAEADTQPSYWDYLNLPGGPPPIQATAALTAVSTLSATATLEHVLQATANLTATSSLVVGAVKTTVSAAPLVATSTLTATATRGQAVTAALTAASTLTATAVREKVAVASLAATSTLTTAGVREKTPDATLSATSTLTANAVRNQPANAALVVTATLTSAAVRGQPGAAPLTASSTLSATADRTAQVIAALTGTSTLSTAGVRERVATAALVATSTLTATATGIGVHPATAALSTTSTLTANAVRNQPAVAALVTVATLTTAPVRAAQGTAALVATSTLTAVAVRQKDAVVALTATSTLTAVAGKGPTSTAALVAVSTLTAVGTVTGPVRGTADLVATSTLVAVAVRGQPATVHLSAVSTLGAGAFTVQRATVALITYATLGAPAVRLRPAAVSLTARSTLTVIPLRQAHAQALLTAVAVLTVHATKFGQGMTNVAGDGALQWMADDFEWHPVQPVGAT